MRVLSTKFLLGVLVGLMAVPTLAQSPQKACGSGFTTHIVPDKVASLCINFQPACQAHDDCYGVCPPDAPDSDPRCDPMTRIKRRLACDNAFLNSMVNSCSVPNNVSSCGPTSAACGVVSRIYYGAVRLIGGMIFRGDEVASGEFRGPFVAVFVSDSAPTGLFRPPSIDEQTTVLDKVLKAAALDKTQPVTAATFGSDVVFVFGRAAVDGALPGVRGTPRLLYGGLVDLTDVRLGGAQPQLPDKSLEERKAAISSRLGLEAQQITIVTY